MKKLLLGGLIALMGTIRSMEVPKRVTVRLNDGQGQVIAREDFERIRACVDGLPSSLVANNATEKVIVQLADDQELAVSKKDFDAIMAASSPVLREHCRPYEGIVSLKGLTKQGLEILIKYRTILGDRVKLQQVFDSLLQESRFGNEFAALFQAGDYLEIETIGNIGSSYFTHLSERPDSYSIIRRLDTMLKLEEESDRHVVAGLLKLPIGVFSLNEHETHYALKAAGRNNSQEVAKLLLEREAEENAREAACCVAAEAGHTEIVRLLLEQGIKNVSAVLIAAARRGQTQMVNMLLDRGIAVDSEDEYGSAALMYAARYGYTETILCLLARGAVLERKNKLGNNALLWAAMNGHTKTVDLLLDKGAFIDIQNTYGNTPLMEAVRNGHSTEEGTVSLLLERKALVDLQDSEGVTALMKAAGSGDIHSFWHLIHAGARKDLKDKKGHTVLEHATLRLHDARSNGPWRIAEGCETIMRELRRKVF